MLPPWKLRRGPWLFVLLGLGLLTAAGMVLGIYAALAVTLAPVSETAPGESAAGREFAALKQLDAAAPASARAREALAERWLAVAESCSEPDRLHAYRRAYHWFRLAAWQQAGPPDERRLAEMARAAAVIEAADAAANRFSLYEGNWHTTYGEVSRDYYVCDDGLILIRDASDGRAGWQGQAARRDGVVLFGWENASALDRPTMVGNRWQLERFVASDYPTKAVARGTGVFTGPERPASFALPQLLVCARRDGRPSLYRASLAGNLEAYAQEGNLRLCPAWSPDGSRVAFASTYDGRRHVFVMDADGKNIKQLTSGATESRCPAWSPDGSKIAFARHEDGQAQVYVMNADGSNPRNLSRDGAFAADPAWSPDGRRIAFASNRRPGGFRLYIMNADGSDQRELSPEGNVIGSVYPCWSPDGQWIAYSGPYQGGLALYVTDPEGRQQRRLTALPGKNTFATWSPDGKAIAFANFHNANSGIHVVSPRGTQTSPTPIRCDLVEEDGRISWRPAGLTECAQK